MTYQIDPKHSAARFKVRHMMIANVGGEFNTVSGTVDFDQAKPDQARVDASIDANSLHLGDPQRDAHVKGADFFDVAQFPTITFKSSKVAAAGSGYKVTGDLTLHGVTKPVTLTVDAVSPEVTDPWNLQRRGLSATATFNRKDFGMAWNAPAGGGVMLSENVEITLDIEMTRPA
ncbi:MAG TPA: YceI family protein [Bryobacteraceae bacterium]|jgi:polyisoprenoid-binding protein YceI|nr:YceI family protein [Bryobacteraceae bacterium]